MGKKRSVCEFCNFPFWFTNKGNSRFERLYHIAEYNCWNVYKMSIITIKWCTCTEAAAPLFILCPIKNSVHWSFNGFSDVLGINLKCFSMSRKDAPEPLFQGCYVIESRRFWRTWLGGTKEASSTLRNTDCEGFFHQIATNITWMVSYYILDKLLYSNWKHSWSSRVDL